MMKVLITGCYGFIGYNFIKHLQAIYEDDILIYGIDKLTNSYSNFNSQVDDTINFFHADINDISKIDQLQIKNLDAVFTAAET